MTEDDVSEMIAQFFEQIKIGDTLEAVDVIFARSPLATRHVEKQTLAVRIENLSNINGGLIDYELIAEHTLGTLCVRRTFLAQYNSAVARWDFVFVRIPSGWSAMHLGFDEGAQDWL